MCLPLHALFTDMNKQRFHFGSPINLGLSFWCFLGPFLAQSFVILHHMLFLQSVNSPKLDYSNFNSIRVNKGLYTDLIINTLHQGFVFWKCRSPWANFSQSLPRPRIGLTFSAFQAHWAQSFLFTYWKCDDLNPQVSTFRVYLTMLHCIQGYVEQLKVPISNHNLNQRPSSNLGWEVKFLY